MSRLVDVPPQRVYGKVPLTLPLIKMSEAEATWLDGQPQIYDKNYPLDYSGLNFDPPWWADTGVGGGLSGVGGGNVRLMPNEMGFGSLGLTAAQQKAQAAAAARQQAAAQKAAANQAAAQAKRDAAQAAKQQAADQAAAAKQQAAAVKQQAIAAKQQAPSQVAAPRSATAAANALTKKQSACSNKGGAWDSTNLTCTLPLTKAQQSKSNRSACLNSGGIWDAKLSMCGPGKAQANCAAIGGTWVNNQCTPNPAQAACLATNPPGTWANGQCTAAVASQTCPTGQTMVNGQCTTVPLVCQTGYQVDPVSGQCMPISNGSTNSLARQQCIANNGYWDGSNCQQQQVSNPQVTQCQQSGGQWAGTYCIPGGGAWGGGGSGGGGGSPNISPIPPDYGGGAPMPSAGDGGGGGMPMTQGAGPGPQVNDQAMNIPTDPGYTGDQSQDQSDTEQTSDADNGSTDDTSAVASTNIFESISKLFSGMNGLSCGCDAAPTYFGMGRGGNAPPLDMLRPHYYEAPQADSIRPSTTTAVVGAAVVLMVGAAAMFLWSKGKK